MRFEKGYVPWNKGRRGDKLTETTRQKMSKAKIGNTNMTGKTRESCNNWKGGFKKDKDGYILFLVPEGYRFPSMKDGKGYIRLSRLIMAEFLNRPLTEEEVVHHKNEIKDDNRIENLELMGSNSEHITCHHRLREEV